MNRNIADLRAEYHLGALHKKDLHNDPFQQFGIWFDQASKSGLTEPNAMILSTVKPNGMPASRIVLLKDFNSEGFAFYTNYMSAKGQEIAYNPKVSLLFPWFPLERQVRIEGHAVKVSGDESDAYFSTRPDGSKLGAWVSEQSNPIDSRKILETRLDEFREKFHHTAIHRPSHWGGYRVEPVCFEFWQGRADRLHDRFEYSKTKSGWTIQRLAP